MWLRIGAFTALSLLVSTSCGSSGIPLDEFDRALAEARCELLAKCAAAGIAGATQPSASSLEGRFEMHPGAVTCADAVLDSPAGPHWVATIRASIAAGRIKYDGAAAQRCVDAIASSCEPFYAFSWIAGPPGISPACDAVFVGQVPLGGTCEWDDDCAGAARCDQSSGSTCGTCVRLKSVGEPCANGSECEQNVPNGYAACTGVSAASPGFCIAVALTENVPAGGTCGLDSRSSPTNYATCAPDVYCRYPANSSLGVCSPPLSVGEACDPYADPCAGDATCAPKAGSAGSACQAVTVQTEVGAPCDDAQLLFCNPLDRLACVSGACALVGTGVVGQPCRFDHASDCGDGLYCDSTTASTFGGLCAEKLADGTPCSVGIACESFYCDKVTNPAMPVCAPYLAGQCG